MAVQNTVKVSLGTAAYSLSPFSGNGLRVNNRSISNDKEEKSMLMQYIQVASNCETLKAHLVHSKTDALEHSAVKLIHCMQSFFI